METDYLIIGAGIAGLSLSIKLAEQYPNKTVTVITKADVTTSNTQFAQGGIAVVTDRDRDSFDDHIQDTLICGGGLCDKEVVEIVITEGPERLKDMISWGAKFDKNKDGDFDLGKEGGHSVHRVVHHKDQTGREMVSAMLKYREIVPNIELLSHYFALDLIVQNNHCYGATILDEKSGDILSVIATHTILAAGGIGQVYGLTTNSEIATGDGIAMAKRANAKIQDMEFIQFHPTALYSSKLDTTFLISEAVRGFGALLKTRTGERFMEKYDSRLELAPRDIVSQSIDIELKKNSDTHVFLDCTHLDITAFKQHFPMIYEQCKSIGIDISHDWIPVAPSQHYVCGGVCVDQNGESSIRNLFVCGESARTGLHGANRLASNSLLEALVYADRIYKYLLSSPNYNLPENYKEGKKTRKESKNSKIDAEKIDALRKLLQNIMMSAVGIVRQESELLEAKIKLTDLKNQTSQLIQSNTFEKTLFELQNMIDVGLIIVDSSLNRKESVGTFVIHLN